MPPGFIVMVLMPFKKGKTALLPLIWLKFQGKNCTALFILEFLPSERSSEHGGTRAVVHINGGLALQDNPVPNVL